MNNIFKYMGRFVVWFIAVNVFNLIVTIAVVFGLAAIGIPAPEYYEIYCTLLSVVVVTFLLKRHWDKQSQLPSKI